MSKPRLHVILSTDDIDLDAMHRSIDRGFQPYVIDGGKPTNDAAVDHASWATASNAASDAPWADLLELFNLSLLVSHASYLAVMASMAAFESEGRNQARRID